MRNRMNRIPSERAVVYLFLSLLMLVIVLPRPAEAKEYVIGAADVIAISVLDNKDLDNVVTVTPGGKIAVPLVGDVQASGLTVAELADQLTREYSRKVKSPQITVTLREVNSYRIYFLGRVAKPGIQAIKSEVTLLQALSLVGGVLDGTDVSRAYVTRGTQRLPVDFVKLLQEGDLSQNITLNPDDTIVFPDTPQNVIYVMGEVKNPGALPYVKERGLTALKAVAAVGGFTQFAGRGRAYLLREETGRRTTIPVDFNELMRNPEAGKDVSLNAGDILVIPQSLF
jgi:polysaccharide biosynthesis/export protein